MQPFVSRIKLKYPLIEFYTALLLFIAYTGVYLSFSFPYYAPAALFTILFFSYVIIYIVWSGGSLKRIALRTLFALMLLLFLLFFLMPAPVFFGQMRDLVSLGSGVGIYLLFLLPTYLLFAFGCYMYRIKKDRRAGSILFAIGFSLLLVFFGYLVTYYSVGDEVLLSLQAVVQLLHGANPYSSSILGLLYAYRNTVGGTLTTGNVYISTMDYPALYFLSSAPFYFLSSQTVYGLGHTDMKIEVPAFLALLLLTLVFLRDRKDILGFSPAIVVFLAFVTSTMVSAPTMLMLALVIIAYARLDSRYAFIPLGLALSIQQELWLPVAFLMLFSLNNGRLRDAVRSILGAAAIFLLVNAYFIALNPAAFFGDIFLPLGHIIPFSATPFASVLLYSYGVGLSLSSALMLLSSAALALLLLYWNRKELIPVFSLVPLLFLFHSLTGYYTFFLFFLVFVMSLGSGRRNAGRFTALLRSRKALLYSLLALIAVIGVALTYQSHLGYESSFGIRTANQSVRFAGNNTVYSADVLRTGRGNLTLYLYLQGYSANDTYLLYGLGNQSLIGTAPLCGSPECLINVNRITMPENTALYHLTAVINGSNESSKVTCLDAMLYSHDYIYISRLVCG